MTGIVEHIARLQDEQSRVAERKATPFIKKYSRAIKRSATKALLSGHKVQFTSEAVGLLTSELTDLSLLSYMRVYSSYRSNSRDMSLSNYSSEVAKFAGRLQINIGRLTKQMTDIVRPKVRDNLWEVRRRLNSALSEITAMQVSRAKSVRLLEVELASMGVTPTSSGYLRTLVSTHSAIASGAALWHRTQADDSVWGYQYVDFGDDRVRPEHRRLDGLIRKKGDSVWLTVWPPNGYNCRCQVVALKTKRRQTRIPKDIKIDEGFDFNPGILLD